MKEDKTIIEDLIVRSSAGPTDNEPKDPSEIPSSIAVTDSCAIFDHTTIFFVV
jgi:hypothetical protein